MKKFKLLNSEGLLSESLNNSNAINNFDADTYKEDTVARGRAIICVTKNNKCFQRDLFENAVKDAKENTIETKPKLKFKRQNIAKNTIEKSLSNSISDLIIPKKALKIKNTLLETNKNIEQSELPLSENCNKNDENVVLISSSSNAVALLQNSFKTPKSIGRFKSFESPMFTSSPIIQSRHTENINNDEFDASDNFLAAIDSSSLKSSLRNVMPSPIVKGRKSVTFESKPLVEDNIGKDVKEKKKIKKLEIKKLMKQKKASIESGDCSKSRNVDQVNEVLQPLMKNVDETEDIGAKIKIKGLKRKSPIINHDSVGVSKKPMHYQKSVMNSPDINETEVPTSNEKLIRSSEKQRSSSDENLLKAPKSISGSNKSSQTTMVTSTPINSVINKKTVKRGRPKSEKLSLEKMMISPITRRTKSIGDQRISQSSRVRKIDKVQCSQTVTVQPIVTRYGRVIRSFAESDLGKYIYAFYFK